MDEDGKMTTCDLLNDSTTWKSTVCRMLESARRVGITDRQFIELAVLFHDFLVDRVEPETEEERMIRRIWLASDEKQKRRMVAMMIRLSDKGSSFYAIPWERVLGPLTRSGNWFFDRMEEMRR
jgi:hypothetical protein